MGVIGTLAKPLFIVLSAHVSTPSNTNNHQLSVLNIRLKGWEALFDRADITYDLRADRKTATSKFKLCLWPGCDQLWQLSPAPRLQACVQDAVAFALINPDSGKGQYRRLFGTDFGSDVVSERGSVKTVLYRLGVLLSGDGLLSESLAHSSSVRLSRQKSGESVTFAVPKGEGPAGARVTVVFKDGQVTPTKVSIQGPSTFPYKFSSEFTPASRQNPFPVLVHSFTSIGGRRTRDELYRVNEPTPLCQRPTLWSPPADSMVYDETVSTYVPAGGVHPIDAEVSSRLLQACLAGREVSYRTRPSDQSCGPEALFFLLNLIGAKVTPSQALNATHVENAGSTIGDLVRGAHQLGCEAKAFEVSSLDIEQIPIPSIILVRPAHFIVVAKRQNGRWWVIDPPAKSTSYTAEQLRYLWSGQFITAKPAQ